MRHDEGLGRGKGGALRRFEGFEFSFFHKIGFCAQNQQKTIDKTKDIKQNEGNKGRLKLRTDEKTN